MTETRSLFFYPSSFILLLFGQPDVAQILIDVVTWRDLPALHLRPMRNDTLPPQQIELINFLIENAFLQLPKKLEALRFIRRSALPLVQIVQYRIVVAPIIDRALLAADKAKNLQIRLVHEIALEVDARVVIALAKVVEVRSLFLLEDR